MDRFAVLVLVDALRSALEENASEITKEHVLRALNRIDMEAAPAPTGSGPYVPAPHHDLPLAQDVVTIVMSIGGLDHLTRESFRAAFGLT